MFLKRSLLILLWAIFSLGCNASEPPLAQKKYPPYPDVWGYDLSEYPAIKWGGGGMHAFRTKDGDLYFLVDISYEVKDSVADPFKYSNCKSMLINFFTGEKKELNEQEVSAFFNRKDNEWLNNKYNTVIRFSDGSTLKKDSSRGAGCGTPDFLLSHLIKTDAAGKEKKYSILAVSPHIELREVHEDCDSHSAPFFYQKVYSLGSCLIDLGDDTFVTFKNGSNLILRFDKNFNTHFKPETSIATLNRHYAAQNFCVIEYALIEELEEKAGKKQVPLNQSIHDGLLMHFNNKYPVPEQGV